jgi:PncC family amidohydrolase
MTEAGGPGNGAEAAAEALVGRLGELRKTFAAAESCTAGLVADLTARVPGASRVFWGSFVAYTPEAKRRMLGVDEETLSRHGAVSRETACAMAGGALERSGACLAAAVTGLAGPEGDGSSVPVGTVWIACALRGGEPCAEMRRFSGSRNEVRLAAAEAVLRKLLNLLNEGDC